MSQPVIQVRDLGKLYRIRSTERSPYSTFREDMVNGIKRFVRGDFGQSQSEDFWALKDVSFDVHQGEVVGIIGRNGAGKSTLLKILSRIVQPTTGEAIIRGRVGSLLEVGTGFHPELTGRENIFMNGAVLGMKRAEIKKQFDAIADFAEVEKFLDTPVKFYSSGMYVRLAFAVAAHLEPEILIVDEVLAVGDAAFQKKCLGKMGEVSERGGRTVLFVSHNMSAMQNLCSRVIYLEGGIIMDDGNSQKVIEQYIMVSNNSKNQKNLAKMIRNNNELGMKAKICQCYILNSRNNQDNIIKFGEPFSIVLSIIPYQEIKHASVLVRIDSLMNDAIVTTASESQDIYFDLIPQQTVEIKTNFKDLYLAPGQYWITIGLRQDRQGIDELCQICPLEVANILYHKNKKFSNTWGHLEYYPVWDSR
jgi:lipopolysaccharide transport system ATP-binding protein